VSRTPRSPIIAVVAVALVLVVAGCSSDSQPDATTAGAQVEIDTFQFEPESIEVDAGTTATWTNRDDILHTVTAGMPEMPTGNFDETLDGAGTTGSVTFDEAGRYDYFCSRHNGMTGTVVVR